MEKGDREQYEQGLRIASLSSEQRNELARELHLGRVAAHNLDVCLRHIEADLAWYAENSFSPEERRSSIEQRRKIADLLQELANILVPEADELQAILPNATLEAIGKLLHPEEVEKALGKELPNYYRKSQGPQAREALGLEYGGCLLIHMIDAVRKPMDEWLIENRKNAGGRPSNRRRRFIILELCKAAPEIIGAEATSTINGRFERLCVEVFHAYDLPTTGISDVIEDVVRELQRTG